MMGKMNILRIVCVIALILGISLYISSGSLIGCNSINRRNATVSGCYTSYPDSQCNQNTGKLLLFLALAVLVWAELVEMYSIYSESGGLINRVHIS